MGILGNLIPPQYKIFAYAGILLVIVTAVFWKGYGCAADKYQVKLDAMELERTEYIAQKNELATRLELALSKVKEVIVTKYVDRVKVIKEKEYVYRDQAINVVPTKCELSSGWVWLHDASARGESADATRSADATPSGIKDTEALAVVTENYSIANLNAEQLKSLQEWVNEAQRTIEEANEIIRNNNEKKKNRWNN